jgi:predicted ATPase
VKSVADIGRQLFVIRGRTVRREFEITSDNAAVIGRICRRLHRPMPSRLPQLSFGTALQKA